MTTLESVWLIAGVWGSGFLVGTVVASGRRRSTCRELMRDPTTDWRRRFSHENINAPQGPPPLKLRRSDPVRMDEGHTQRGNGNDGPTTPKFAIIPKSQPPRGRIIDAFGMTIGYQPLPRPGSTTIPPPREP